MVHVTDRDAFALMAAVEGPRWGDDRAARRHFDRLLSAFLTWPDDWGSFCPSAIDIPEVIYGAGGYHRYRVGEDGEIVFLGGFATSEGIARAKVAGFRVQGGPHRP